MAIRRTSRPEKCGGDHKKNDKLRTVALLLYEHLCGRVFLLHTDINQFPKLRLALMPIEIFGTDMHL